MTDLAEFQPTQWWLEELEKHWGRGESSDDTRRAARVACEFVAAVFALRDKTTNEIRETGLGVFIGVSDCNGRRVHIGDTIEFDYCEWWRGLAIPPDQVDKPVRDLVRLVDGEIVCKGNVGGVKAGWSCVVKGWDSA